jgi:pyruvate,water dikinase
MTRADDFVIWFPELGRADVGVVGGKNASLGELINNLAKAGVRVPGGFATTADAYREFLSMDGLRVFIADQIDRLHRGADLAEVGHAIRRAILATDLPADLAQAVTGAYRALGAALGRTDPDVAVRSSATAEDLPEASFAGQQESFLNVRGEQGLLAACKRCYASLFTDRAIHYREDLGFDHLKVALSVGVQQMVRSDLAGAGVMFSIDTETGFPRTVLINASWGLGETVVGGMVDPDEYLVFKPLLDEPGRRPILSRTCGRKQCKIIYADGPAGARTRTVDTDDAERAAHVLDDEERRSPGGRSPSRTTTAPRWTLSGPKTDAPASCSSSTIMKRAAAIVTDHGGRTSHAAIVSRELGVAAIVGTTNATSILTRPRRFAGGACPPTASAWPASSSSSTTTSKSTRWH